jgi:hypothetical protein
MFYRLNDGENQVIVYVLLTAILLLIGITTVSSIDFSSKRR